MLSPGLLSLQPFHPVPRFPTCAADLESPPSALPVLSGSADGSGAKRFWKPTWFALCWCQQVATAPCSTGQPRSVPCNKRLHCFCQIPAALSLLIPFLRGSCSPSCRCMKRCSKPGTQSCSLSLKADISLPKEGVAGWGAGWVVACA